MAVTLSPRVFNKRPVEDAVIPLPIPEMTPPDTSMYFMMSTEKDRGQNVGRRHWPMPVGRKGKKKTRDGLSGGC